MLITYRIVALSQYHQLLVAWSCQLNSTIRRTVKTQSGRPKSTFTIYLQQGLVAALKRVGNNVDIDLRAYRDATKIK